ELLIHHPVQRQQRPSSFLPAVQTLRRRINEYSVISERIIQAQHVRKVSCQSGGVIHQQAVERSRLPLCICDERIQRISPSQGGAGLRLIETDKIFRY